ncbi:DUF1622 domain-containing protein [Novosphingobium profundi]|uniref:DUF1622 domain-containing protein n=1 Tax=Novosphingobium profundi TaxID=1774954 RepID=UPI001BDAD07F|nr:DUF1622 domain-containing protein [Novosphingobium profundi]MBT0669341.1 DUF1622 domain-containing protein [Novosphingobium profundi]
MEESFKTLAEGAALVVETLAVLTVFIGAFMAALNIAKGLFARTLPMPAFVRSVWQRFAAWILISLEFALGADIIRTAIAPTWDDIGKLAAIAAIRTFLGFFLDRDMKSVTEIKASQ